MIENVTRHWRNPKVLFLIVMKFLKNIYCLHGIFPLAKTVQDGTSSFSLCDFFKR